MSTTAPTPFGSTSKSTAVSSGSYPPMASKAPTPFGAPKSTSTSSAASKSASSGSYPPMSTTAPTPFGSTSKSTAVSSGSYPPMASKAPTPFGSSSSSSKSGNVALSTSESSTVLSLNKKKHEVYHASSEYEAQFWNLVSNFHSSLEELKCLPDDDCLGNDTCSLISAKSDHLLENEERSNSAISILDEKLGKIREFSVLLQSRNDDLSRQIGESEQLIKIQTQALRENDLSATQPLDLESEKIRQQLAEKSNHTRKALSKLNDRFLLMKGLLEVAVASQQNNSRSQTSLNDSSLAKVIFTHLKKGYERTEVLEPKYSELVSKLEELSFISPSSTLPSKPKPLALTSGKNKIASLPFVSPKAIRKAVNNELRVQNKGPSLEDLRALKKQQLGVNTKHFNRRKLSGLSKPSNPNNILGSSWRAKHSSALMDNVDTAESSNNKGLLLSPTLQRERRGILKENTPRSDWQGIDTKKFHSTPLALPNTLKQIDATNAETEALVPFGTTPTKMLHVHETKKRNGLLSKSSNTSKSMTPSSSGSYPPISSKAPTPFGTGASTSTVTAKTASTGSYPPISATAPTPFGSASKSTSVSSSSYPPVSSKAPTPFGAPKSTSTSSATSNSTSSGSYPPMSATAPTPFGSTSKSTTSSSRNHPPLSFKAPTPVDSLISSTNLNKSLGEKNKDVSSSAIQSLPNKDKGRVESENSGSLFSGLQDLGKSLTTKSSRNEVAINTSAESSQNFQSILTEFYKTHNPDKVNEVEKTLQKYKGREHEMFSKIAKKYNVPNPLSHNAKTDIDKGESQATNLFGSRSKTNISSPFESKTSASTSSIGTQNFSFGGSKTPSAPFGGSNTPSAPFGGSSTSNSPFGGSSTPSAPFGGPNTPITPFNSNSNVDTKATTSPFGSTSSQITPTGFTSASAPSFGQVTSPAASTPSFGTGATSSTPQPFAAGSTSNEAKFGGKTAREILVQFYQQHKPAQLAKVDSLLAKYAGREEQMLRNIAKKYNIDPLNLGLTASNPSGFGSALTTAPSTFGQPSGFGSQTLSTFGQSTTGFGASGSSQNTNTFGKGATTGFGSFAQGNQNQTSGFGTLSSPNVGGAGFGTSTSTPFGSARR